MSDRGITAKARRFYEQFPFPGRRPIDRDGLIFLRRFAESIDQAHPAGGARLRVLDAGCGTGNTSLSLARHFAAVDFVGIDQSRTSLAHAREAAGTLPNLLYRRWNLLRPLPRTEHYDIILCLGVLHHTADMKRGLLSLRRSLAPHGVLYLWIYGRHGRYRHSLNVRLLSMFLRAKPSPTDMMEFTRVFIQNAGNGALLSDLPGAPPAGSMQSSVFDDPVWIADQFLNPQEKLLDMAELLSLVSSSGFSAEQFLGLSGDPAQLFPPPLQERFQEFSRTRQLIALDLLLKPERYFVLLRRSGKRS